jgi:hypothetical protein
VALASNKAEDYRRLARESFQAANRLDSEEDRKILLHIGEVWQRFAEQEERKGSASAQQQQQVQPKDDDKME